MTPFIFDCDGTLVETHKDIAASARHVCERLGIPPVDEAIIPGYMGLGIDHLLRRILGDHGDRFDEARRLYMAHHDNHCTDRSRLYDGAIELLDALRSRGCRLGLLSNKTEHFCRIILEKLDVAHRFDLIYGSDSTPWKKPDCRGLLQLAGRLGGSDALYIGDSSIDIDTAHAARARFPGMRVGFVEHGYGRVETEKPDYTWSDLRALLKWVESGA
ncbi:MAG: HAD-IA family hydrolase [Candidatus Hydrogenedentota bacterium]